MSIFSSPFIANNKNKVNSCFPEFMFFLVLFCIYLYPRIRNPYIFSYAGLYMEMSESILKYHYALPLTISYYGPGGIPFTYPPLAFYLCAFIINIFKISIFQYVRYAPIIFYTGALIALYLLVRKITESRAKGIISAFLYGTSNIGYIYHAQESGMVRGLALFFTLVGLIAFHNVFTKTKNKWSILIGTLCLACLALTHFNYLIFFIVSIPVLLIFGDEKLSKRLLIAFFMCTTAALLTVPWLIIMFTRYGITPFLSASSTHGSFFQSRIVMLLFQDWSSIALVLVLVGFCYMFFKKKWLLPVWFLAIFLFVGEGSRFLFLIGVALSAEAIIDFYHYGKSVTNNQRIILSVMRLLPILFLLSYFGGNFLLSVKNSKSLDVPNLITLASWFKKNTSEDASYLLISNHNDYGYNENMPFFLRRTPVILPWGGEWKDSYDYQMSMSLSLNSCIQQDSVICIYSLLQQMSSSPDYLITYNENNKVTQGIRDSRIWQEVYENPKFIVYQR